MYLRPYKYIIVLTLSWSVLLIYILSSRCFNTNHDKAKIVEPDYFINEPEKPLDKPKAVILKPERPKIIVLWNDLFGRKNWNFDLYTTEAFEKMKCDVTNCLFTDHRDDVFFADAVFFHLTLADRPAFRLPRQRWIFLRHEPPYTPPYIHPFEFLVNWTQGYRPDSDIFMSYGEYCKRDTPLTIDFQTIVKQKTKKIAWFVSNCYAPSKRNEYVKELMKYIDVDVYGACSYLFNQNNNCVKTDYIGDNCFKMIEKDYKFYLSFESCFHDGYITEKYFHPSQYNIITIVRGDGNYSEVIPNSYINTKDFDTIKKLAIYLNYLDKNNEEYIKYLKHREIYRADLGDPNCKGKHELGYCKLCRKLNDPTEPIKTYANLNEWYGTCREPTDIK